MMTQSVNDKIRLISTDFDGTLFADQEVPPVPKELEQYLKNLQSNGTVVVINTGRDIRGVLSALEQIETSFTPDYLVVVEREIYKYENGKYVGLESWNDYSRKCHENVFLSYVKEIAELFNLIRSKWNIKVFSDEYSPLCIVANSNEQADEVDYVVTQWCKEHPGLAFMRNHIYARLCSSEFNKGEALRYIQKLLNISIDKTFAAGDELNDLQMLKPDFAKYLAAPGNAISELKSAVLQYGGYVSNLNYGHGLLDSLKYYLSDL